MGIEGARNAKARNVARAAPRGMHLMARSVSSAKTAADSRPTDTPNQKARLAYTQSQALPLGASPVTLSHWSLYY